MSGVTRSIRLPIAPAGPKTCGSVKPAQTPALCQYARTASDGHRFTCRIFSTYLYLKEERQRLLRWPECIAAEVEDG